MPQTEPLIPVTVSPGDGIGPEILSASLEVLKATGAPVSYESVEIGESVYRRGVLSGIDSPAWDSIRRTKVFLKAPITTPQGGGYKSLNVTIRKTLGLYANVRPAVAYHPFVATRHPKMDVVIVRENEEDLYAGIEHQQTDQVVQCLKLITRPGCERIVRYAFEYARSNGRKKVSCFTKDNIMKLTDGLFHRVYDEIGREYPDIQKEHWIVDIGAAKLADAPEQFDVIVLPNLYGDVLSDVSAEIAGSVGLGGSANIGEHGAMFEAIHGSAPDIAGQDVANPSGLMLAAVMMLVHLGRNKEAEAMHNALLATIEEGIHTADIYNEQHSSQRVGTRAFAQAVVTRLGRYPQQLKAVSYASPKATPLPTWTPKAPAKKEMVGVDVFLDWRGSSADELAAKLKPLANNGLQLKMITNRGVKVWPDGMPETFCTDHWRCRFLSGATATHSEVVHLLDRLQQSGFDFIKTEHLCTFDGQPGFSLGQGQ